MEIFAGQNFCQAQLSLYYRKFVENFFKCRKHHHILYAILNVGQKFVIIISNELEQVVKLVNFFPRENFYVYGYSILIVQVKVIEREPWRRQFLCGSCTGQAFYPKSPAALCLTKVFGSLTRPYNVRLVLSKVLVVSA